MTLSLKQEEVSRTSLELLYHISRELTSALELRTVLQRVLMLSMRNVGAQNGSIIVLDDNGQPVESTIIIGDQIIEHTTPQLQVMIEHGLAGWVLNNNQAALIPDTARDERWLPGRKDEHTEAGSKSAVSVPIVSREQAIGVLTLVHPTPGFFTLDHLALIQAIADQAGVAVLNARLYAESQRQARVMTAVAESAAAITTTLDLDEVLQRILQQVTLALRVEAVSLALIDPQDNSLRFMVSTNQVAPGVTGLRLGSGEGIAGWVIREGHGVIIPDTTVDARFRPEFDRRTGFLTRAVVCAPITARGKIIGVLEAINPSLGSFEPDSLQTLTEVGSLAGAIIQNAQLFEQLQTAHQRYQELFEDNIDPILITNWQGNIVEANQQAALILETNKESLLGKGISRLLAIQPEQNGDTFKRLASGETVSYESTLQTLRGISIPIQMYVRRVKVNGNEYIQWICRDLRERKSLDKLRNDLISMIYHDLRSPLANIVSSLDVIDAMLPGDSDPSFRSLLNIALRSVERIQRLTNSLLDLSRLESGQPVVNLFPTPPSILARDALEAVQPVAENKNQTLLLTIPADTPYILVDADMIRRVLINLLENAIKFTPPGGHIELGASLQDEWVRLWVQDDGPGIPELDQDRIFNKFIRLNQEEGPQGFGMGLAYCRLAVEGHRGRIWVESQPGVGSKFSFILPLAKIKE
jgi:PAS domain S-box-containing protein